MFLPAYMVGKREVRQHNWRTVVVELIRGRLFAHAMGASREDAVVEAGPLSRSLSSSSRTSIWCPLQKLLMLPSSATSSTLLAESAA
jgi:hypothetical protein